MHFVAEYRQCVSSGVLALEDKLINKKGKEV